MADLSKITGTSDTMFKAIMYTHKDILKAIMELCIGKKLDSITIMNNDMPVRTFLEMRKSLDVYTESINTLFDVEVTNDYNESIKNRNLAFGFNIYNQGVSRGGKYDDYKPTTIINLISGKKNKPYGLYESYLKDQYGSVTTKMLLFSEFYIDYYVDKYYNKNDEENIIKYKYLIMLGLNKEELIKFNERYGDRIVNEYTKSFVDILKEKPFEELFDRETDEMMIRNSYRSEGFKDGEKHGEKRGIKIGADNAKLDLAKKLKNEKVDLNLISRTTGLSIKKVMTL